MAPAASRHPYDPQAAVAHLRKIDPQLRTLIDRMGDFEPDRELDRTPFEALLGSIVYQQLSGRAAETIYGRLLALYPDCDSPGAADILDTPVEELRGCGLSAAKVRAVKDLAAKTAAGSLPDSSRIAQMSDQQIIDAFTDVRGIGRWTVEMLLMFNLGRADVLPATDLGIRRGFMKTYGLQDMPTPAEVLAKGEQWTPYRSVAAWYLWRAADEGGPRENRD